MTGCLTFRLISQVHHLLLTAPPGTGKTYLSGSARRATRTSISLRRSQGRMESHYSLVTGVAATGSLRLLLAKLRYPLSLDRRYTMHSAALYAASRGKRNPATSAPAHSWNQNVRICSLTDPPNVAPRPAPNGGSVIVLPACGGHSALWPDLWLFGEGRACADGLIPGLPWKSW
jgi:hypothetical protein